MDIAFASYPTSLGHLYLVASPSGIRAAGLLPGEPDRSVLLAALFPGEDVAVGGGIPESWVGSFLRYLGGETASITAPLALRGTPFQEQVWTALAAIPSGETRSYGEVAEAIGRPTAARAVARACAQNPVALAIPCHRVLPRSGGSGGYRWGEERKRRLLEQERRLCGSTQRARERADGCGRIVPET